MPALGSISLGTQYALANSRRSSALAASRQRLHVGVAWVKRAAFADAVFGVHSAFQLTKDANEERHIENEGLSRQRSIVK